MDSLKDRYFIRLNKEGKQIEQRLPLANKQTLLRTFIHFICGDYQSIEVWNEEYLDKKVMSNERINGKLVRKHGQVMRDKIFSNSAESVVYSQLANQFREGLYDPESSSCYSNETSIINRFDEEQFEDIIELLTHIQQGKF